jgi:hypothetical protein
MRLTTFAMWLCVVFTFVGLALVMAVPNLRPTVYYILGWLQGALFGACFGADIASRRDR